MANVVQQTDPRDEKLLKRIAGTLAPPFRRYFRPVIRGLDRVPQGKALYVGNHSGGTLMPDAILVMDALLRKRGLEGLPFGLGHDMLFKSPTMSRYSSKLGIMPAHPDSASQVFAMGRKAMVYPGGELDNMRAWRDRNRIVFGHRRGYIRLALQHGVPIVPIVAAGAQQTILILDDGRGLAKRLGLDRNFRVRVLPIALTFPWGLTIAPMLYWPMPSRIYIEILPAIKFRRSGEDAADDTDYVEACHRKVYNQMQAKLSLLAAERREWMRRNPGWWWKPRRWPKDMTS